jgi:hypothetical protein
MSKRKQDGAIAVAPLARVEQQGLGESKELTEAHLRCIEGVAAAELWMASGAFCGERSFFDGLRVKGGEDDGRGRKTRLGESFRSGRQ